jgi:hypothetical protein
MTRLPVARFVEEMLRWIRREFFPGLDKRFFQERPMLIRAVTFPAHWMNKRGVQAPAPVYRRILGVVIQTIKSHGNQVKFRSFSLYLFKAVQQHMNHHGEQYYYEAHPEVLKKNGVNASAAPGRCTGPCRSSRSSG